MTAAVVPAAGKGQRFGGAKLVATVEGEALINRTLRSLLDGGVDRVVVVAEPDGALERGGAAAIPLLGDRRVELMFNADPDRGMFSSIREGLAICEADTVLVLPADMPFVKGQTVAAVIEAAPASGNVVSPRHKGQRGHPVALPAAVRLAVLAADEQSSLKQVLADLDPPRKALEVDDPGVLRDVDVVDDLGGSS